MFPFPDDPVGVQLAIRWRLKSPRQPEMLLPHAALFALPATRTPGGTAQPR